MKYSWWTYAEINDCKTLFMSGCSVNDIARKLDRDEISVRNLLVTERVITQ